MRLTGMILQPADNVGGPIFASSTSAAWHSGLACRSRRRDDPLRRWLRRSNFYERPATADGRAPTCHHPAGGEGQNVQTAKGHTPVTIRHHVAHGLSAAPGARRLRTPRPQMKAWRSRRPSVSTALEQPANDGLRIKNAANSPCVRWRRRRRPPRVEVTEASDLRGGPRSMWTVQGYARAGSLDCWLPCRLA
jgi:hypothetical protein